VDKRERPRNRKIMMLRSFCGAGMTSPRPMVVIDMNVK
jgi:hypothetical protein